MKDKLDLTIDFLKVISDKTRLQILELLKDGYHNSKYIQDSLKRSQSTISQQLKILQQSDLINIEKDGVKKYYKTREDGLFEILDGIAHFVDELHKEKVEVLTAINIDDVL